MNTIQSEMNPGQILQFMLKNKLGGVNFEGKLAFINSEGIKSESPNKEHTCNFIAAYIEKVS